jgi:hypothetical protein
MMTREFLHAYWRYLDYCCQHPCPDENVHELRRARSAVARLIEDFVC